MIVSVSVSVFVCLCVSTRRVLSVEERDRERELWRSGRRAKVVSDNLAPMNDDDHVTPASESGTPAVATVVLRRTVLGRFDTYKGGV